MFDTFKTNDVVMFKARGGLTVHGVVTEVHYLRRGRNAGSAKFTVAPLPAADRAQWYTVPQQLLRRSDRTFTQAQLDAAVGKVTAGIAHKRQVKETRAASGREAIGDFDAQRTAADPRGRMAGANIAPGDKVLVEYRGGTRQWETVGKVNLETGKVGLVRQHARAVDPVAMLLAGMAGRNVRGPRELRWIPAQLVKDVRPADPAADAQRRLNSREEE